MADAVLETVIKAHDQFSKVLNDYKSKLDTSGKAQDDLTKKSKSTGFAFTELFSKINLVVMAGKALTDVFTSVVGAIGKVNRANIALETSTKGMGLSFDKTKKVIQSLSEDGLLDYADSALAVKRVLETGLSLDKTEKLFLHLKDVIASSGIPVEQYGASLQSAADGISNFNVRSLQSIGFVGKLATEFESFAKSHGKTVEQIQASNDINELYNFLITKQTYVTGQASKMAETYEGKVKLLKEQFEDLQEDLGKTLLPVLNTVAGALSKFFKLIEGIPEPVKKIGIEFAAVTVGLFALTKAFKMMGVSAMFSIAGITTAMKSMSLATKANITLLAVFAGYEIGQSLASGDQKENNENKVKDAMAKGQKLTAEGIKIAEKMANDLVEAKKKIDANLKTAFGMGNVLLGNQLMKQSEGLYEQISKLNTFIDKNKQLKEGETTKGFDVSAFGVTKSTVDILKEYREELDRLLELQEMGVNTGDNVQNILSKINNLYREGQDEILGNNEALLIYLGLMKDINREESKKNRGNAGSTKSGATKAVQIGDDGIDLGGFFEVTATLKDALDVADDIADLFGTRLSSEFKQIAGLVKDIITDAESIAKNIISGNWIGAIIGAVKLVVDLIKNIKSIEQKRLDDLKAAQDAINEANRIAIEETNRLAKEADEKRIENNQKLLDLYKAQLEAIKIQGDYLNKIQSNAMQKQNLLSGVTNYRSSLDPMKDFDKTGFLLLFKDILSGKIKYGVQAVIDLFNKLGDSVRTDKTIIGFIQDFQDLTIREVEIFSSLEERLFSLGATAEQVFGLKGSANRLTILNNEIDLQKKGLELAKELQLNEHERYKILEKINQLTMDTVAAMKEELQFSIDMGDEAVDTVQEQIDAWKNLATTINNSSDLTADQKRSLQRDLARTTKQLSKDISNGTTLDTNIAMQSKTVQVEVPKIQNFNIVTNVDQRGQIVETSGIANWYNQLIAPLVKGTVTDEILKRGGNV